MEILGIDVGGSGIKAAIVDTQKGELISKRHRLPTPKPAKPHAVAETVHELIDQFEISGPVGLSFPTVIAKGRSLESGNLEPEWKDLQVDHFFEQHCTRKFFVINDADAAGMAEMTFGAGKGKKGLVLVITIGTGLGSGMFYDGVLIPNIELGRILGKDGKPIEFYAADSARKKEKLSYPDWGKRFNFFLQHVVRTIRPDLFILGGGASKKLDKFQDQITIQVPYLVAEKRNNAGIIGAAMYSEQQLKDNYL